MIDALNDARRTSRPAARAVARSPNTRGAPTLKALMYGAA